MRDCKEEGFEEEKGTCNQWVIDSLSAECMTRYIASLAIKTQTKKDFARDPDRRRRTRFTWDDQRVQINSVCLPGDVVFGWLVQKIGMVLCKCIRNIDIDVWPTEMMNRLVAFIKKRMKEASSTEILTGAKEFEAAAEVTLMEDILKIAAENPIIPVVKLEQGRGCHKACPSALSRAEFAV